MEDALKKVEKMEADLGGTEILEPLKDIYSKQSIPSHPRQLFVFTDGEVGNTKDAIDLVRKNSDSHRVDRLALWKMWGFESCSNSLSPHMFCQAKRLSRQ
ncbi:hypothetical protein ATANTOWER_023014 [Ataeniobius toweri]|uniref:VWFA domain-containing protein n=1 Tax=Ataeniobius toweri TaxID=208326 RepID=A0ABU7B939_9TELE|nr:hypothetical protein [Ataeniobius toweri]